jgi:hypothetical protein
MNKTQCIYIRVDGVLAFHIDQGKSVFSEEFDNLVTTDSTGIPSHSKFQEWLKKHPNDTYFILVDVVEEEFVVDSVPAMRKKDQIQVIKRRISQKFRDVKLTQWVPLTAVRKIRFSLKPVAQETSKILYSALPNDALLTPWLTLLERSKVAIESVVSPALLAQRLVSEKLSAKNGLIMSWAPAGLRQTLIIDKQIRFSRLSGSKKPVDQETVIGECQRTIQYLLMSQQISRDFLRDSSFTIWLMEGGISETEKIAERVFIDSSVELNIKLIPAYVPNTPDCLGSLPTWYKARKLNAPAGSKKSGYANSELRYGYRIRNASRWIVRSSTCLTFCAMLISLCGLAAKSYWPTHISEQTDRVHAISQQEASLRKDLAQFPIPSAQMQKIVELDHELRHRHVNPLPILQLTALSLANRKNVTLSSLRWQRLERSQIGDWQSIEILSNREVSESKPTPNGVAADKTMPHGSATVVELQGSLKPNITMQEANDGIREIVNDLSKQCQCEARVIKLPFDPNSTTGFTKSFASTGGVDKDYPKFHLRWLIRSLTPSSSSTNQTTKTKSSKATG